MFSLKSYKKKLVSIFALTFLFGLGLPAISPASAEVVRVAHADSEQHPKHLAFLKFAEIVTAKTNGELSVQVFPSGQLGDEREIVEGLQQGTVHLTSVSNGVVSAFSKSFMLLDIPYLFEDYASARRAIDGPGKPLLFSGLDKIGLVGLSVWEQGFRNISSSKSAVDTADKLKGLKLRTMEAPLHVTAWKAAGANPTPMSWSQVYPSLQQGVIDGQENPLYVVTQEKLYEVQKFVSLTRHIYDAMPVLASKKWFDGLSQKHQKVVRDAIAEVTDYERGLVEKLVKEAEGELPGLGVKVVSLTSDNLAKIRAVAQPAVVAKVKAELGDALVDGWLKATAK